MGHTVSRDQEGLTSTSTTNYLSSVSDGISNSDNWTQSLVKEFTGPEDNSISWHSQLHHLLEFMQFEAVCGWCACATSTHVFLLIQLWANSTLHVIGERLCHRIYSYQASSSCSISPVVLSASLQHTALWELICRAKLLIRDSTVQFHILHSYSVCVCVFELVALHLFLSQSFNSYTGETENTHPSG